MQIVGWFDKARVYRDILLEENGGRVINDKPRAYNICGVTKNSVLLPASERKQLSIDWNSQAWVRYYSQPWADAAIKFTQDFKGMNLFMSADTPAADPGTVYPDEIADPQFISRRS